jgi:hypothetical protein
VSIDKIADHAGGEKHDNHRDRYGTNHHWEMLSHTNCRDH